MQSSSSVMLRIVLFRAGVLCCAYIFRITFPHDIGRSMNKMLISRDSKSIAFRNSGPMKTVNSVGRNLFEAAYRSVLPGRLVSQHLEVWEELKGEKGKVCWLKVGGRKYELADNVYIASFGKAALGMAAAAQGVLGKHCIQGLISTPSGSIKSHQDRGFGIPERLKGWEIREGAANNLPDESALQSAVKVRDMAETLSSKDILIACVSGGGSALLPLPHPQISLEDKTKVIKALGDSGASIFTLNTVRQHLSLLKGGGLARLAFPAQVIGLLFSDLVTDDPQFIASGPTVPLSTSPQAALDILGSLPSHSVPSLVTAALEEKVAQSRCKVQDYSHVNNLTIGNNQIALEAAREEAERAGFTSIILTKSLSGEAEERGSQFADLIRWISDSESLHDTSIPHSLQSLVPSEEHWLTLCKILKNQGVQKTKICLIWGGETTVNVKGKGVGGRNQEIVLSCLLNLRSLEKPPEFEFLSAGTDGQDGPCDAAGASISFRDIPEARKFAGAENFLKNNDSYAFFTEFNGGKCHYFTGMTGTNVMDIQILLINS